MIGDYGIVKDNSYNSCIDYKITEHIDLVGKLVKIVSEPYSKEIEFWGGKYIHQFVLIEYKNIQYEILNSFFNSYEEYDEIEKFRKHYEFLDIKRYTTIYTTIWE